ncbi:hypothetical protein [Streptomyces sp. NBRC 109706]|uniref:hypothetical protein n=1 Tax=Streptomyces sp. NBRC 109706 TaxID=1550035 RepID=UPI0007822567|nr:hypothetical protein [Streptomyces sp. NBRC 109706]
MTTHSVDCIEIHADEAESATETAPGQRPPVVSGFGGVTHTLVRRATGGITFTMIEPDRHKAPGRIDEFLHRDGGSEVQHLAFLVNEIVPAVLEFEARGVEFLGTDIRALYEAVERARGQEPRVGSADARGPARQVAA